MVEPVVKLESGLVRGVVEKHPEGFHYYAFKGIPYGEPPVGELRFQDPVPVKNWSGVKDCQNYGSMCLQYDLFTKATSYNEDCLHLNVFTQSINKPTINNPVMVIIHGGALHFGCADDLFYGPEYLIRKQLVIVTITFRLNILGFLDLEDEIAPGNQGMKDQVMALEWIQQNIRQFGGDPNNVTVYGTGAGGCASHYLALSPMTKGLMHKVISASCATTSPFIYFPNPREKAIKFCSYMGKDLKDPKEILEFLKKADVKQLVDVHEKIRMDIGAVPFGPGNDYRSPNPFFPFNQDEAAEQGVHLPYLTGYCADEGLLLLLGMTTAEFLETCNEDFMKIFKFGTLRILDRHNLSAKQVHRLYFKGKRLSGDLINEYIKFAGHFYFIESVHRLARIQAEKSSASTYLYVFSYDSAPSLVKYASNVTLKGANHLDDLPYLFKMRVLENSVLGNLKKGTDGYRIMDQMTEMWANFARYGRPTIDKSDLTPVHWKPLTDGTLLRYLNIDEDVTMQLTINLDQKYLSAKDIKV